ncbi:collagen alpha-2(IV) chain-like [Babylonia areolata]|uniref:collagen alpha-2(IV) chain-like n=1 Tax=Babylonia areolata TaxID=304850 RepID=UPI003FD23584
MSGGQPLASPGSCLELFYTNPFIECSSRGQCHFFSDKFSYWLTAQRHTEQLDPEQQTLKNGAHRHRISRCRVCVLESPQTLS